MPYSSPLLMNAHIFISLYEITREKHILIMSKLDMKKIVFSINSVHTIEIERRFVKKNILDFPYVFLFVIRLD